MDHNTIYNSIENTPPCRVKIEGIPSKASRLSASHSHSQRHWPLCLTSSLLLLTLVSCIYDDADDEWDLGDNIGVGMSIRTLSNTAGGNSKTYEVGSEWENYIDIAGGDFRIYFFTYDKNNPQTNDTLIAEFEPKEITATDKSNYTTYDITGVVGDAVAEYADLKVVVLANWGEGHYPAVEPGVTTIDDICAAGTSGTALFDAFKDSSNKALIPDGDLRIPFYGVHEYSGLTWEKGWRTTLAESITLLRAVAKVEVILMDENGDGLFFDNVSIVGHNAQGCSAPAGVYSSTQYDHGGDWDTDFTDSVHLAGGANESGSTGNRMYMTKVQENSDEGQETWVCYLPEYDNTTGADYSYIQIDVDEFVDDTDFRVYFSNYGDDGLTSSTADYDIFRNCLYRFYVTYEGGRFIIRVNNWEDVYDNDFTFGEGSDDDGN